jgi:hypothetical protein
MCDPISIAGLVMSTAGGAMKANQQRDYTNQVNAQNKAAADMSSQAREAERLRQAQFEREQTAVVDTTRENVSVENFNDTRQTRADSFMDMLDERPDALNEASRLAGQGDASGAVKESIARASSEEAAKTRERIKALAALTGYSGTQQDRSGAFGAAGADLSTIGGLRRGSLTVGNQEQQIPAASVRPGDSTFADMLSGAGGLFAASGGGMFPGMGGIARIPTAAPITSATQLY